MKIKQIATKRSVLTGILTILVMVGGFSYLKYGGEYTSGKQTPSPLPSPTIQPVTQWAKIEGDYAIFVSRIFMKRDQTQIIIPIKFEKQFATAWLGVSANYTDLPTKWLISHPQLNAIDWQFANEGSIYLYKKNPDNLSLKDFIANPPKDKKILIDDSVKKLKPYQKIPATDLAPNTNISDYDYILTTFKRNKSYDTTIEYINVIDLTHAVVDDEQNLNWSVQVDTTKDNPMYMGPVHVDYIQYDRGNQK